ncbi:hypothetical protein KBQ04_28000, partial [Klebsiella pneumoniae]|uniref:hypothetical protein n=1 Tax=Klebsiella pneumoniae TaxID=573 RepID=UPI0021833F8B|nr:hypothetical protein [Klebsiella pneumoniae]MCT2758959.1 hypothetical protein [Klebsiella pneumoniae]MCT2784953.1 hypothetical protein [Klebsiella pneumoniae]MCT2831173.1 hypothetical protein [Klebsiella pneumoniae]
MKFVIRNSDRCVAVKQISVTVTSGLAGVPEINIAGRFTPQRNIDYGIGYNVDPRHRNVPGVVSDSESFCGIR